MGVKYFYSWLKRRCSHTFIPYKTFKETNEIIPYLLIDLNSIVHTCAQMVWKYGDYAEPEGLLVERLPPAYNEENIEKSYSLVCDKIDQYINDFCPEQVVIALDGVAPMSKQQQQRQRRYLSCLTNFHSGFDRNSITPGTDYLKGLSSYIRMRYYREISCSESSSFRISFTDETNPGEGEHKLVDTIRYLNERDAQNGLSSDSIKRYIVGIDSDLIMICLAGLKNTYVIREEWGNNEYLNGKDKNPYTIIDIPLLKKEFKDPKKFVRMCFILGNDFLPSVPFFEINNTEWNALDQIKECNTLKDLGEYELKNFNSKWETRGEYYPDPLLERCVSLNGEVVIPSAMTTVELSRYKEDYYSNKIGEKDVKKVCLEYLKGMAWVWHYYTKGIPSWTWYYPYSYAPFLSDLLLYESSSKEDFSFSLGKPKNIMKQLFNLLPFSSRALIPDLILLDQKEDDIEVIVDVDGKKHEHEATIILRKKKPSNKERTTIFFGEVVNENDKN